MRTMPRMYFCVLLLLVFGCQGKEVIKKRETRDQSGPVISTEALDTETDHTVNDDIGTDNKANILKKEAGSEKQSLARKNDDFYSENAKQEGILIVRHNNGNLAKEIHYKKGKLDGLARFYYENGRLKREAYYQNGKPEGIVKTYYSNGSIMEEWSYKNGLLDGTSTFYDANGKVVSRMEFSNGKLVSRKD